MIEAELPDGTILEFPDGTDQAVIQRVVKQRLGVTQAEPQQEVSTAMDVAKSLGSGLVRGGIALAETPELLGRLGVRGYQEAKQLLGGEVEQETPIFDTVTGRTLREATTADDYQAQTTAGKYAGTVGEFLPAAVGGPAGLLRRGATVAVAGVGSEAAGQATEGTVLEPVARVVGAFAAPMALSKINKTAAAFSKKASEIPTVAAQHDAAKAAYKAVDNAGIKFSAKETDDLIRDVEKMIAFDDAFAGYSAAAPNIAVNKHITDARKLLISKSGTEFTLPQLVTIRRDLKNIYRSGTGGEYRFDPRIEKIIDVVDKALDSKQSPTSLGKSGKDLLDEANALYTRAKKSELLEDLMQKAELSAAGSGSGGNVVNKYRQAITSILNDPRKKSGFGSQEIEVMEKFVRGSLPENAMRLIGKLSPTGNGLMAALNVGAAVYNPAMLLATVTGFGAKIKSEAMAKKSVDLIRNMIATGAAPEKRKLITDKEIRILLGSTILQKEEPEEQ